jgi:hypothetical protein
LLVTAIGLAAYSRADTPAAERKDFFVYIDEFQSFTTLALARMLSELRKYRVGFTVAHQYLNQLEPDVRHAVLGNVGSVISFRVGAEDAPYLVRRFSRTRFGNDIDVQETVFVLYAKDALIAVKIHAREARNICTHTSVYLVSGRMRVRQGVMPRQPCCRDN